MVDPHESTIISLTKAGSPIISKYFAWLNYWHWTSEYQMTSRVVSAGCKCWQVHRSNSYTDEHREHVVLFLMFSSPDRGIKFLSYKFQSKYSCWWQSQSPFCLGKRRCYWYKSCCQEIESTDPECYFCLYSSWQMLLLPDQNTTSQLLWLLPAWPWFIINSLSQVWPSWSATLLTQIRG